MPEYNTFLENVYSDELIFVDPDEFDEVNRLMAEEGYHDFSLELEQQLDEQEAWIGSKQLSGVLWLNLLVAKVTGHISISPTRIALAHRV